MNKIKPFQLLPLLLLVISTVTLKSQTVQEDSLRRAIVAPIQQFFAAYPKADTTGMAALFHPDARLNSIDSRRGEPRIGGTEISALVANLAKAQPGDLYEELHYIELRIDGDLATAWTPYTFVYKGEISHCGVNTWRLTRSGPDGSWQIYDIMDTRRRGDCERKNDDSPANRLDQLANQWHQAATDADAATYFGLMADEAIFIGTDSSEHWNKAAFEAFATPYFKEGKAWDFKKIERHLFVQPDDNIGYWDELLDTWMGPCRGTGIARRNNNGEWKILHYTLSVTVPNDDIQAFIELVKE